MNYRVLLAFALENPEIDGILPILYVYRLQPFGAFAVYPVPVFSDERYCGVVFNNASSL